MLTQAYRKEVIFSANNNSTTQQEDQVDIDQLPELPEIDGDFADELCD
ncbi:MAG TPA: hypothetical protein VIQ31_00475 [Phormidium sp.]